MIIDRVTVQNFLSFGPEQTLELNGKGLVFVEGENRDEPKARSNGAGKSALLEALVWCLSGKTIRGLKGDAVIHRKIGKGCAVSVAGRDAPGALSWRVRRYRKVERKSGLEFYLDGRDVTLADVAATQALIERTLGVNFDLLTNTIVFGQGDRWRFAELTDAPRKALLDQLVGAQTLVQAYSVAREAHARALAVCNDAEEKERDCAARIVMLKKSIATIREEEEKRLRDLLGHLRRALKQVNADIRRTRALGNLIGLPGKIATITRRLKEANDAVNAATDDMESARERLGAERARVAGIETDIDGYTEKIERVKRLHLDSSCEYCGAAITSDGCDRYVVTLGVECNDAQARLKEAHKRVARVTKGVEAARTLRGEAQKDARFYEAQLKGLEARSVAAERLRELEVERTNIRRSIADIKEKRTDAPAAEKRLGAVLKKQRKTRRALRKDLEALASEVELYRFWVDGFGNAGIKSHLLDHVVPLLNRRAAKYSQWLMDGLTVEFDTESATKKGELRDRFDVSVYNESGADVYAGNSGGEQRKADIVVARALQSLEEDRLSCNVAWWDEVFESLDETSCEAVMGLLRDEAESRSSVFVVSHLDWLRSFFPRVLRVVKERGFTRLEWGE